MTHKKQNALILAAAFVAGLGMALPASATDYQTTCARWDETQSIRCFDCMERVWTGHDWQLLNTCQPRATPDGLAWSW